MKAKDPETGALLPVLERIAGALEKIDSRLDALERFERTAKWYDQYLKLTTAVSRDSVATMRTTVLEAVPQDYLEEEREKLTPEQQEDWFRKLLFFQRIYEYLFATISYSDWYRVLAAKDKAEERELLAGLRDEEYSVLRWIQELVRDPDFRMVHVRQGQYYPKFAKVVDKVLDRAALEADERSETVLAAEIRAVQEWAQSDIEFDEFCKLDKADPEYQRISGFIMGKGHNPSRKLDWRRVWVAYPGFKDQLPPTEGELVEH